jgi:hypothetical protein
MITENQNLDAVQSQNGGTCLQEMLGRPDWRWVLLWVVLTTLAIPTALLLTPPITIILQSLSNLAIDAGLVPSFETGIMEMIGFSLSFALTLAAAQWLMLRSYLPHARLWFLATGTGILTGGIFAGVGIVILSDVQVDPGWGMAGLFLLVGCLLGAAQWLVLRRIIQNAYWILPIDIAGACAFLLVGGSITNLLELLVVLLLPGVITGIGIWSLLRHSQPEGGLRGGLKADGKPPDGTKQRSLSPVRIRLGLAALVPMFFLCIWIYAASQLALAKNEGIYATVEEAVITRNSQGWGGAEVVKVEDVRASVNQHDGSQPHVWFGGAEVYLDRVPRGGKWDHYAAGSYYLHVEEGWVHVPEGAFPEFIGWVMGLYGMEGVNEWVP